MALTKVCPQCGSVEHCRRSACGKCGFVFAVQQKKKNIVRESGEYESEMECDLRRENDGQGKEPMRVNWTVLSVEQVTGSAQQKGRLMRQSK